MNENEIADLTSEAVARRELRVQDVHGYGDDGCSISLLLTTDEGEVRLILNGADAAHICEVFDVIKDTRFLNIS